PSDLENTSAPFGFRTRMVVPYTTTTRGVESWPSLITMGARAPAPMPFGHPGGADPDRPITLIRPFVVVTTISAPLSPSRSDNAGGAAGEPDRVTGKFSNGEPSECHA